MPPNASDARDPGQDPWHDEYYHLQDIVSGYNSDCLTIKNWSVTVASAAIAYAYGEQVPGMLLLSAFAALCFLCTEAYWRANQYAFIQRILEIEGTRDKSGMDSPAISSRWKEYWERNGPEGFFTDARHIARWALSLRTALPHALIVLLAIFLLFWCPPRANPDAHAGCKCCAAAHGR